MTRSRRLSELDLTPFPYSQADHRQGQGTARGNGGDYGGARRLKRRAPGLTPE